MSGDVHDGGHPPVKGVHGVDTHSETGLPIKQCPGYGQHSTHNWNIYDPAKVKLSRVNPAGDRTCLGYSPFAGITSPHREAMCADVVTTSVGSEVNPDAAPHLFEPYDWQRALSASVAAHAEKTSARRAERAELKRRRDYGLRARYAAKEARNRGPAGTVQGSAEPRTPADTVANECHQATKTQVTASSPDGQTGTDSPPAGRSVEPTGTACPSSTVGQCPTDERSEQ